jgi:hypothetical protein
MANNNKDEPTSAQPKIDAELFFDKDKFKLKEEFIAADDNDYYFPKIYTVALSGLHEYYKVPDEILKTQHVNNKTPDKCVLFYMMGSDLLSKPTLQYHPQKEKKVHIILARVFMFLDQHYERFSYQELEKYQHFSGLLKKKIDALNNNVETNTFLPLFIAQNDEIDEASRLIIEPTVEYYNTPATPTQTTVPAGTNTVPFNNAEPSAKKLQAGEFVHVPDFPGFQALLQAQAAGPSQPVVFHPSFYTPPQATQPVGSQGAATEPVATQLLATGGGKRMTKSNKSFRKIKKTLKSSNKSNNNNKKTKKAKSRK